MTPADSKSRSALEHYAPSRVHFVLYNCLKLEQEIRSDDSIRTDIALGCHGASARTPLGGSAVHHLSGAAAGRHRA
jgi:hypothetical protein